MVHEELYIIVDGARKKLDLPSPSGITLNFVSNLFNDLSKINASYSYTFKLPRTANNVRVLELVDDVRADGKFTRIKNDAEFVYDGVSLFSNANMYISNVENDTISAVLTWNVNKGLQELSKHDMSLNELGNHLPDGEYDYVGDEGSEYEKDKVIKVAGWDNGIPTFNKMSEYNSAQSGFRSLHNSGVFPYFYAQVEEGRYDDYRLPGIAEKILHFPPENSLWVEDNHLNANLPFIWGSTEIEYERAAYYTRDESVGNHKHFKTYAFPTPIVPVPYLMNIIGRIFNLNLDFSGDLYNSLCVPLVTNNVSDALARLNYVWILVTSRNVSWSNYLYLSCNTINRYSNINPLGDQVVTTNRGATGMEWRSYSFTSFKSDYFESKFMVTGNLTIEVISPEGSHNMPAFYEGNYPKILLYTEAYKDDEFYIAGELLCTAISYRSEDGVDYTRLNFNFNPQDGNDAFLSDPICKTSFAMRLVWGKDEQEYLEHNFDINDSFGALYMSIVPTNYTFGCHVNLFKNLPDISCVDFIKSVCYALGGYPYQTGDGAIMVQEYTDIIDRIDSGDVSNWSDKILKANGANTEDFNFDPNNVTSLTLAKKNYFLMKNDKLDEYGNEEENDKLDDAYKHGYECIEVDSDMLDNTQTLFTFPFYGGFLWEKGSYYKRKAYEQSDVWDESIARNSPKGGDRWALAKDEKIPAIANAVDLICDCRDSKPMLGVVEPRSVPVAEITRDTTIDPRDPIEHIVLIVQYTGQSIDYLSMRPWNCATDMPKVNGRDLLQELFGNPCLVNEEMNLNVADLAGLDIEKPVFLEKYNSYFAIKNIEVSSSDGISKVELIRIPPELFDPAAPTPEIVVEEPTLENGGDNGGGFEVVDPWAEP